MNTMMSAEALARRGGDIKIDRQNLSPWCGRGTAPSLLSLLLEDTSTASPSSLLRESGAVAFATILSYGLGHST